MFFYHPDILQKEGLELPALVSTVTNAAKSILPTPDQSYARTNVSAYTMYSMPDGFAEGSGTTFPTPKQAQKNLAKEVSHAVILSWYKVVLFDIMLFASR